jgi:3-hydroxy-9,10-secoandrosta-1,3,5(10)-triene-9,17-dione monooxygenase reductase component
VWVPEEGVIDSESDVQPVKPEHFRDVLSHFATGVVVVTGLDEDGSPVGMTAQSLTSLSLDPPLVLVCPARSSTSWPRIAARRRFAVNVLGADQKSISGAFARRGTDKFASVGWSSGEWGMPLLSDAMAHIECDLEATYPGGDHHIAIGRVRTLAAASIEEASPLLFFRSRYWVAAPHPQVDG